MKPKTKSELMAVWASRPDQLKREREVKAIRRVGNEYADMLFEYDQQRRKAEKQCEQLAMEGMMKK
jgi:hypothetical protein